MQDLTPNPALGVGSAGEAALKLGRRFIGMEIEEPYFKAAKERLVPLAKFTEQTGVLDKLAA